MTVSSISAMVIALLAVLLFSPHEFLPWSASVHHWGDGLIAPIFASICLFCAAYLLPKPAHELPRRRDGIAIAIGLLFIVEPIVHVLALWWSTQQLSPSLAEAILPAPHTNSRDTWIMWAEILILAPCAEEWFFRGRLLPWLQSRLGTASSISITTLAFAAAHLQPLQALIAIPLGLLFAWLRLRGCGVTSCIIAHSAHNALFLLLGSQLISVPTLAPILVVSGLTCIALAWLHLSNDPTRWRHFLTAALVLMGTMTVLLVHPSLRRLQDSLWVNSAHHLCVVWRIENDDLLRRLDAHIRSGKLSPARRESLLNALESHPCQTIPRQRLLLATLDPLHFPQHIAENDAESVLEDLFFAPAGIRDSVARDIGRLYPDIFARLASHDSRVLQRWLPLPENADVGAQQLAITTNTLLHRALLNAWEKSYPGQVIEVLMRLPTESITMNDRRHLWLHYPFEAAIRIHALELSNPTRAHAYKPEL